MGGLRADRPGTSGRDRHPRSRRRRCLLVRPEEPRSNFYAVHISGNETFDIWDDELADLLPAEDQVQEWLELPRTLESITEVSRFVRKALNLPIRTQ